MSQQNQKPDQQREQPQRPQQNQQGQAPKQKPSTSPGQGHGTDDKSKSHQGGRDDRG